MSQPEMLYRNLLDIANAGRGDGTVYAWGNSSVISGSTFDLTTINIMTDLGADADDKFNGYKLVFTSSGRSYLITDWVAATDVATVFETPNAEDTGAYTIRRTLYTNDFNVANPIRYGANGRLYQKWVDKAANNAVQILACAPNLIDDGGFERNSLTAYWTTRGVAGTGTVAINATTPILGTYDCKFNQGDQAYVGLEQATKGPLRKGYTYGIIMKTGGDAGAVTDFRVSLEYVAGSAIQVPVTFTEINAGDDIATANIWKPAITDANAWDEITFTVSEDIDSGDWKFVMDQYDLTDVFIDEIYIWEIGPGIGTAQPDTLIIGNHNMAGGFGALSEVGAMRAMIERATNSILQSRAFDTTWVVGQTPILTQNQTGIDGVANKAWTIEDDRGAGPEWIQQDVTIADDSESHTFSLYVQKDDDETRFPEFELVLQGGTLTSLYFQINTKTGASAVRAGAGTATVVDVNADWWRVSLTVTNNSTGNTTARCSILPAKTTVLGTDGTATGSIVIDAAQFELNSTSAGPFIETTTVPVSGDAVEILNVLGTVNGNSPIRKTWTAKTSIYPVHRIQFAAISGKTWEAGEIWLGQRWTWTMYPDPPITAKQLSIESTSTRARGGPRVSSKIYEQTIFNGSLELVSGTEADIWKLFISYAGHGKPFWLRVPAQTNLGVSAETVFVNCKNPPTVTPSGSDAPTYYTVSFNFEEAF